MTVKLHLRILFINLFNKGILSAFKMTGVILTHFCWGLSSTLTMSSLLEGIPFKTSAFRRRSMWGPSISWSFLIWSSLATSSNSVRKLFWLLKNNLKQTTVLSGLCWSMYGIWYGMVYVVSHLFQIDDLKIWCCFLYLATLDSTCYMLLAETVKPQC